MLLTSPRGLWAAVVGLSLDQLVAWGVLYYAYAILSEPIAHDLGLSHLVVAGAFSVCLLVAGSVGRRVGSVLDARGTRGVLRLGALVAPIAFASIAFAEGAVSLVAAFAMLGVAHALALYEPAFRTIVDWCPVERTRARALLLLTSVGGLASTLFLPLTGWLVEQHGWRAAVGVLATLLACVLLAVRASLPLSERSQVQASIATSGSAPRSIRLLALGLAMHALVSTGVFVQLPWHLVERGESIADAAAIAGLAGAAQVPGRLLAGPLRRLVGSAAFLACLFAVQAAALLGLAATTGVLATTCVLVLGAANGMMTLERATLLVEWYGRATFGTQQGRVVLATSTARAVSPLLVAAGHCYASYALVFGALAVILVLGAAACRSAAVARSRELRAGGW